MKGMNLNLMGQAELDHAYSQYICIFRRLAHEQCYKGHITQNGPSFQVLFFARVMVTVTSLKSPTRLIQWLDRMIESVLQLRYCIYTPSLGPIFTSEIELYMELYLMHSRADKVQFSKWTNISKHNKQELCTKKKER